MSKSQTFLTTLRKHGEEFDAVLSGVCLTAPGQCPVEFRLDAASAEIAGCDVLDFPFFPEVIEDCPSVNVFESRREAEKQAPVEAKPKPAAEVPTAEVPNQQLTLDFSPKPKPEPVPARIAEKSNPDSKFSDEEKRELLSICHQLQRKLYGEQWLKHRKDIMHAQAKQATRR